MKQHLKRFHGIASTKPGRFLCHHGDCSENFYHATQLVNHYRMLHGVAIKIEEREFPNMTEFFLWKEQEEASSCSTFVQPNGEVVMQGKPTMYH